MVLLSSACPLLLFVKFHFDRAAVDLSPLYTYL